MPSTIMLGCWLLSRRNGYLVFIVTLCGVTFAGASCFSTSSDSNDEGYSHFATAAARAPDEGYRAYWLGREFRANELLFRGPSAAGFGSGIAGGGVLSGYAARLQNGGDVVLELNLYSHTAWAAAEERVEQRDDPMIARRQVSVAGRTGELLSAGPIGDRPVIGLRLILDLGDTVLQADAPSGGATGEGGADVNPLIDEQTFLRVIQNIRPYPE